MPCLRELAATQAPLLFMDAASARIQTGLWLTDGAGPWRTSEAEAGIGLFRCLEQLEINLDEIRAFVFCDGPGSILGIRTVAMALRTWSLLRARPIYSYSSLVLAAHALGRPEVAVIADARRESWHHYKLGEAVRRVLTADLQGELAMPENFRQWSKPPPSVRVVPYSVPELLAQTMEADLFRANDAPDAFLQDEPKYISWTPHIHQAEKQSA